jgi:hypothetical protein
MCYILRDKMNIHFTIQQQKKGLNFMNFQLLFMNLLFFYLLFFSLIQIL